VELIVQHADGEPLRVSIERHGEEYRVAIGDRAYVILAAETAQGVRSLLVDGGQHEVAVRSLGGDRYEVTTSSGAQTVKVQDPLVHMAETARGEAAVGGRRRVDANMPGRVVALLVEEGASVRAGQGVVVLEAMKMENEIAAERDGRIGRLHVRPGQAVETGDPLFELD
jgi:glutaconyl-CoA/methylmalonyl-CoA decarboxylase subunit gamma